MTRIWACTGDASDAGSAKVLTDSFMLRSAPTMFSASNPSST